MEIDGIEQAIEGFKSLGQGTQWAVLSQATAAGAREVAKQAKQNAPTGKEAHYAYNGQFVAPGYAKSTVKAVRFRKKYQGVALVAVGPNLIGYYLTQFVERGHATRSGGFIPADPWLKPALDNKENDVLKAFVKKMDTAIDKAIKKGNL